MSVELYLFIIFVSAIFTIFLTSRLKRLLNRAGVPYRANAVALDAAMLCSTLVSVVIKNYLNLGLNFSATQVTRLLLVMISTWFLSMLIYDKAVQTREQYRRYRKEKEKIKEREKNAKELRIQKISEHSNVDEGGGDQSGQDDGSDSVCDNRNDSDDGSC